ncbi:MAG: hypothetical protein KKE84_10165 [Gammaproteobacteria bacterium]|nr:hypothetical protein [Gammaproteobacteria bacterium]
MNAEATNDIESAEVASDTEAGRYEKAYRETRRALDESIETLMVLEELETSPTVRDQIALKRLELETSRSNMVRANIAFHTGRATMNPPSPAQVAEIVQIAKKSVELTVDRATAAAVVKLATSALNKFAQIQEIGNG